MTASTYMKIVDALGGPGGKKKPKLAVVVTSQGACLAWEDTLMPDFGIPVDIFDGATGNLIHKAA
jgi:hypothetical protein